MPLWAQLGQELRPEASGDQRAQGMARRRRSPLVVEHEDVLHRDDITLHAHHLGHVRDAAGTILEPGLLDHQVDGTGDLLADRADGRSTPAMSTSVSTRASVSRGELAWTVEIEPSWPVFIAWSMSNASAPRTSPTMIRSGRMRSGVLTRSRTVHLALALDVRRACLEPDHVLLVQPQLGCVLDRDDPFASRDEAASAR